jgi:chemosensory pili system protein ChpB (putative protein-glutamate methylesterase)
VPSIDTRVEVAVGLVHPAGDLHTHLSDALRDLGASIVYEAETAKFDRAALDRSGAQVVIVNLDPDSDEQVDAIDDLLVDDRLKVVFNDGEVSSKLSGYDLARWARHLAAKIVGGIELLPPRPAGAEAVPVRSMPQHALTTSDKPRSLDVPAVSDQSMRDATDAIADALASFDVHTTKLESKNAEPAAAATDIDALLGDFGLSDVPDTGGATNDNPFADLGLELDAPAAVAEAAADVEDLMSMGPVDTASDAAPESPAADGNPFGDLGFDLDFDKAPARPVEAVGGIDDLLAQLGATAAAPEKTKPETAPSVGRVPESAPLRDPPRAQPIIPKNVDLAMDMGDPTLPPASREVPKPSDSPLFSFNIDHLALEPTAEERGPDDPFADRGMASESVLHGARASQKIAPAAPAAPAASAPKAIAPLPSPPVDDQFSFSLDDTVELSFEAPVADVSTSSQEEDDFMREFAAMTAGGNASATAAPAATGGALARVWVLGASIGGPDAVREFLAAIPPGIGAAFVLAQHMGADFVDLMVTQLQKATRMPVAIATSGMHVGHGQVLVVPIAERMLLEPSGDVRVVALDDVSPYSPSIDRVLIDIGDRFGSASGAIIFSGMAHDAIEGAKHLAVKGGQVWAQDPSTCVVSSMIDGAMEAGIVSYVGTPADLAAEFVRRYGKA